MARPNINDTDNGTEYVGDDLDSNSTDTLFASGNALERLKEIAKPVCNEPTDD